MKTRHIRQYVLLSYCGPILVSGFLIIVLICGGEPRWPKAAYALLLASLFATPVIGVYSAWKVAQIAPAINRTPVLIAAIGAALDIIIALACAFPLFATD